MKYSLLSVLVGSLLLAGCGGDGKKNTQSDTPKPVQPQPDANSAVITLGSNNNVVSLSNVAQATFSTEDAQNNPTITLSKIKIPEASTIMADEADSYDIQKISSDEIKIITNKPLSHDLDIQINVPTNLSQLADEQGVVPYIIVFDAYDELASIIPLESVYYADTQSIQVKLPVTAFSSLEDGSWESVIKLGVTKLFPSATNLDAQARSLTGTSEDPVISEKKPVIKCPLPEECVEVSAFSPLRYIKGKGKAHSGIDLRADAKSVRVPVDGEFKVASAMTTMEYPNKAGNRIHLHSTSGMLGLSFFHLTRNSIIDLKKDTKNKFLNVKFGDIIATSGASGSKVEKIDGKLIKVGDEKAYNPHLHFEVFLPELKYKKCKDKICSTPILKNAKNQVDPFAYLLQEVELKNISEVATLEVGKPFKLQLQGYDGKKKDGAKKVSSEIIQEQGSRNKVRKVIWKSSDPSAVKFEQVSNKPEDYDKQKVTVLKEGNYKITAYWDGVENLKAEYSIQNEDIKQATLTISNTQDGWDGLPATMLLTELNKRSIYDFQSNGNSDTCETGERGTPLFSQVVDSSAIFYSALTATGVPNQLNGPFINRKNCSSFVAVRDIPDPTDVAKPSKKRIWINATGRAWRINSGAGVISDWEYQVRYDSGDPFNNFLGKRCDIGVVPNSGVFVVSWKASDCKIDLK